MVKKLSKIQKIVIATVLVLLLGVGGFLMLGRGDSVGHMHMTAGGGFRDAMVNMVNEQFEKDVSGFASGSGDLRGYLTTALAVGQIGRGTIFTYNHLEVNQQLEKGRDMLHIEPNKYNIREEFSGFIDPLGQFHVVWLDAYVIIYNADLIATADVPRTWEELANFDQPIAVMTTGCMGTWGTRAFYSYLGEENFARLMNNAIVTGGAGDVSDAVVDGDVAVGIGTFLDVNVIDNKVSLIWPDDGAIGKPAFLALPKNPNEKNVRLADILMSEEAAKLYKNTFNVAPALAGTQVPQIFIDNNFNLIIIPSEDIICTKSDEVIANILGN